MEDTVEKKSRIKKPEKTQRQSSPTLRHFRLTIAYRGTDYQGWQKQAVKNGPPTVQEKIENAARKIFPKGNLSLHGSGRTDSGVHARAQVAHLRAEVDLPALVIQKAINSHLPEDIRILSMEETNEKFHAQLSCKSKTYRYFILNTRQGKAPVHWPFLWNYSWFVTYPLDFEKMSAALAHFCGTHDFKSFQNKGTPVTDTVREITEAKLIAHANTPNAPPWMPNTNFDGTLLEVRITGTGFLKQMVRTIVGTVVEVGRGKLEVHEIGAILNKKNRSASGITAPAHGLFLDEVRYE